MATRSVVVDLTKGYIDQMYIHWDGDPENVGKMLMENYNDTESVQRLIELRYASDLHPTVEQTAAVRQNVFIDEPGFPTKSLIQWGQEFEYFWDNSDWYVRPVSIEGVPGPMKMLKKVI